MIYPPLAERKPRAGARGWRCRWMGGGELLLANELLQRRQSGFEVGTELAQRVLAASAEPQRSWSGRRRPVRRAGEGGRRVTGPLAPDFVLALRI